MKANIYKEIQIISIQDLVLSSQDKIMDLFHEYGIDENSLFSDVKKIILYCSLTHLITVFKPNSHVLLISQNELCCTNISELVGKEKCLKSINYMINNLRKIFKHKFLEINYKPDVNNLPGEVIESILKHKTFNFKALQKFVEHNSLSGLKKTIKEDLSLRQKIYSNFQD